MGNLTLHAESLSTCFFKSSAKVPIRSICAHFEPTQTGSGEPSYDNVREIIGYDSQPIYITSSDNFFKNATLVNGYVRDNTGQEVESSTYYYVSTIFDIDTNNANYYVLYYHNTADVKFRIYFLDANGEWINRTGTLTWRANNNFINFLGMLTKPENYKKIQFQFANTVNINDIEFMTIDKIQVDLPILGKNKLNSEWENGQIVTGTGQPQASTSSIRLTNKINVIPGKTYVLSWTSGNRNIYRFAYKKDGTFSRYLGLQSVSGSSAMTFQSDEYYLWIYQWNDITPPENIQLELGSTATEYEPYSSNNIIYGGYVDPIKGIAVEEWTGSKILNGTTDTSSSSYTNYVTYLPTEDIFGAGRKFTKRVDDALTTVYCDSLPISYDYTPTTFPYLHLTEHNGFIIYTVIMGKLSEHPEITDVYDVIAYTCNYLQEHNVTVRWKSTPIEYPIESIMRTTQMGTNFVWGTTSSNHKFEVDYDLHETRAIQFAKRRIAANEPHLETLSDSTCLFHTDLCAPYKGIVSEFHPLQASTTNISPTNPVQILGRNRIDAIVHDNVNLFHNIEGAVKYNYFRNDQGAEVSSQNSSYTLHTYDVTNGTPVIDFGDGLLHNFKIYFLTENNAWISRSAQLTGSNYVCWDIPVNCAKIQLHFYNVEMPDLSKLRIYNAASVTSNFGSAIGELYGGKMNHTNGELLQTYYNVVADGINVKANYKYSTNGRYGGGIVYLNPTGLCGDSQTSTIHNVFCNTLPVCNSWTMPDDPDEKCLWCCIAGALYVIFYLFDIDDFGGVEPTKEQVVDATNVWLQQHPTTIVYQLANPIQHQISSMQLKTMSGTNVIWTPITGSNTTVSYWTH